MIANLNNFSQGIRNYFLLSDVNTTLSEENARLRRQLERVHQSIALTDSLAGGLDSTIINRFDFVSAKVVNNQVDRFKNFITISKGRAGRHQAGDGSDQPGRRSRKSKSCFETF